MNANDELIDAEAFKEFSDFHGEPQFAPVAIVIASYKERENIGRVVASIPTQICGLKTSVVVVIDGEEDGSAAIVRENNCFAVVAPVNRGQGAALRLGYHAAERFGATYIVTADADGQTDPNDLAGALQPIIDGEADFVNGSRRLGATESTDAVRNTGVLVYAALITVLTRTKITDTANPVRAMSVELAMKLQLDEPQYQASELLISAIMSGARYAERPITMRARKSGKSKKGGNLVYGYRYGKVVLRTFRRERRRKRKAALARFGVALKVFPRRSKSISD